jgi:hypothetical protein
MSNRNFEDMYYNDLDEVPDHHDSISCHYENSGARIFVKSTSYPASFSLTPAQRDGLLLGQFDKVRITNINTGHVIWEAGEAVFRVAALNAKLFNPDQGVVFYVVKF